MEVTEVCLTNLVEDGKITVMVKVGEKWHTLIIEREGGSFNHYADVKKCIGDIKA